MLRFAFLPCLLLAASLALADESQPKRSWAEEKCFRYHRDWGEAFQRFGREGISADFIRANESFIGSGCVRQQKICPHTPRERQLVDILAIRVVNVGMSTTFLPFDCH
jgi:hypothetical protein